MLYQGIIGGGSSPVEPVDLSPVLLWTNPSPTSTFGAQTVELNLTEYAGVIVEFNRSNGDSTLSSRSYIKKGENGLGGGNTGTDSIAATRNFSCNDTGVTFAVGYVGNPEPAAIIPTKIYGVKEYVAESDAGKKIVPSDYVNFNASTGFTAVVGTYYAVVQGSDSNADPTFNGATILKTGYNQRTSSADRAYLSIIQATSTTITSNKNGTYCALNLE